MPADEEDWENDWPNGLGYSVIIAIERTDGEWCWNGFGYAYRWAEGRIVHKWSLPVSAEEWHEAIAVAVARLATAVPRLAAEYVQ